MRGKWENSPGPPFPNLVAWPVGSGQQPCHSYMGPAYSSPHRSFLIARVFLLRCYPHGLPGRVSPKLPHLLQAPLSVLPFSPQMHRLHILFKTSRSKKEISQSHLFPHSFSWYRPGYRVCPEEHSL